MSALNENALTLLNSETIDTQNGDSKTIVYTVPVDKTAIITMVIVHTPSANLVGGSDFNIGSGDDADTWKQRVDLSWITTTSQALIIHAEGTRVCTLFLPEVAWLPIEIAGAEFGIKPVTGTVANTTAIMAVFGYLF